ncbi:GntR family transcriptional regulator [Diplocloster hominis]|uniref:GntR family transcriptional regulator n=1 Tax=Diplocloster hominis TaxID=3079010 RepID=UPI0031BB4C12
MTWMLNSDRPIYAQIIEKIQTDIVSGIYHAGDKLPSVRELAAQASVNPNTMQKALSELERDGLLYSQRTSGRFITEDREMIQNMKQELAKEQITLFLEKMNNLGFKKEETFQFIQQVLGDEKN